jgi:hypothetical protein
VFSHYLKRGIRLAMFTYIAEIHETQRPVFNFEVQINNVKLSYENFRKVGFGEQNCGP